MPVYSKHWDEFFQNCVYMTNCLQVRGESVPENPLLFRCFYISSEISLEDIDRLFDLYRKEFAHAQSPKFWYGTILHACIEVLCMSNNHTYSNSLLYLMLRLLENKVVDEASINTYEQTPLEVLKYNILNPCNEIDMLKNNSNMFLVMCAMFMNMDKYKSRLRHVYDAFRDNMAKIRHKKNHHLNLTAILCSPPGQVELNLVKSFPGGSLYHRTESIYNSAVQLPE